MRRAAVVWLVASWAVGAGADVPVAESYRLHCSGCHGPDGSGVEGAVPSLRTIAPLLRVDGGREYLTRVPGVAQAPLPSDELARLLNFVLAELAGADGFDAFSEAEVEAGRAAPLRDPASVRPDPSDACLGASPGAEPRCPGP